MMTQQDSCKPELTLRISLTDRCQLRCDYCMPIDGISWFPYERIMSFEDIVLAVEILQRAYDIQKVRLTGGEPLLRKNVAELIRMLKDLEIPDLALTTNGLLLAQQAQSLKAAGLDRLNISLDSLDEARYCDLTHGGNLQDTLCGIEKAAEVGFAPIKINSVIMKKSNEDEIMHLLEFSLERGYEQRFLELMPIGHGCQLYASDFVATASVMRRIREKYELIPISREPGSSSVRYELNDSSGLRGTVGFISPCSDPFCADCHRLRMTTEGKLIGCLARENSLDARTQIGNPTEFLKLAAQALNRKRTDDLFNQKCSMAAIGG